jgi:hypothetical protein
MYHTKSRGKKKQLNEKRVVLLKECTISTCSIFTWHFYHIMVIIVIMVIRVFMVVIVFMAVIVFMVNRVIVVIRVL